jgi:hypothetical protein
MAARGALGVWIGVIDMGFSDLVSLLILPGSVTAAFDAIQVVCQAIWFTMRSVYRIPPRKFIESVIPMN